MHQCNQGFLTFLKYLLLLNNEEMSEEEVESRTHKGQWKLRRSASWQQSSAHTHHTETRTPKSKGFVFFNTFLLIFREMKGEGDRNIDQLPPGHETETWAYALPGIKPVISGARVHTQPLNYTGRAE